MRLMNEGLAELVGRHPDRFPAFAGTLSLLDPEAAIAEVERAAKLGAVGFQICTHVRGSALDEPRFRPVIDAIAQRYLAIWLHPVRGPQPDYASETRSHHEIWWCFGWPYDSSVAMARLAFSGIFDRHPQLKIITHHMGAMIPYFAGRIEQGWGLEMGARTPPSESHLLPGPLKRPAPDYFRMFYAKPSAPWTNCCYRQRHVPKSITSMRRSSFAMRSGCRPSSGQNYGRRHHVTWYADTQARSQILTESFMKANPYFPRV
jgi:hypothetical protein